MPKHASDFQSVSPLFRSCRTGSLLRSSGHECDVPNNRQTRPDIFLGVTHRAERRTLPHDKRPSGPPWGPGCGRHDRPTDDPRCSRFRSRSSLTYQTARRSYLPTPPYMTLRPFPSRPMEGSRWLLPQTCSRPSSPRLMLLFTVSFLVCTQKHRWDLSKGL